MNIKTPLLFHFSLLAFATILLASCSRGTVNSIPRSATAGGGEVRTGETNEMAWGPIRRDSLTDEQIERIEALHRTFAEVDEQTLEEWIDNFKRDLNLEEELAIWERVANAYSKYCESRELSLDAKQDVYSVVLSRSTAAPDEVVKMLDLTAISEQDARDVMAEY